MISSIFRFFFLCSSMFFLERFFPFFPIFSIFYIMCFVFSFLRAASTREALHVNFLLSAILHHLKWFLPPSSKKYQYTSLNIWLESTLLLSLSDRAAADGGVGDGMRWDGLGINRWQECIALQPTMLDFMQRRGRVLKKMGAFTRAAEAVDGARQLDKADRYMNSKVWHVDPSIPEE